MLPQVEPVNGSVADHLDVPAEPLAAAGTDRNKLFRDLHEVDKGLPNPLTLREQYQKERQSGIASTLDVPAYLCLAANDQNQHNREPCRRWQSRLFLFVRLAKAHPQLHGLAAAAAFAAIDDVAQTWDHQKGECPWLRFLGIGRDDAAVEILDAWDKVRFQPPGCTPLQNALQMADERPLILRAEVMAVRFASVRYPRFVALAGWLQVCVGDRPILLPVREVAKLFAVEPMTISRYRQWALKDGYLVEVQAHQWRGAKKGGKATEFRFQVEGFDCLQEKAV
jgi:hypothetical protein